MADIYNFNTLIHEKYPELVEYWLETFNEMIKLKQDYDDLSVKHAELIGLNDMLMNIIKAYNLECKGVIHGKSKSKD